MWVESDTNMPGGEALARQFVAGKRFFLEEFGVDCAEVWLPDSFGYSAALPQIMAAAGARWFLTQKTSWNDTNTMPHHTFAWEGIDGTRIFTHFPPVDTYGAELSGAELARAERRFAEKGRATRSLVPFGWGDGGGGPTREMLAAAARTRSLEGSPTVRITTPAAFFAAAEEEYLQPPVWSGELYLEFHRGTYTSQARTKRGNRRSRAPAARGRALGDDGRGPQRGPLPLRPAGGLLADRAAAAVPRHPAGHVDRLGAPAGRAGVRPGSGRAGGRRRHRAAGAHRGRARSTCTPMPGRSRSTGRLR